MFLRLEELVLANSGEDEFEEVFKLLIAKIYTELSPNQPQFKAFETESETAIFFNKTLNSAQIKWPGILENNTTSNLTDEHLHICVKALSEHKISDNGLDVLDSFFEFMVSKAAKGNKGQFFTPRHVVEFCVRMLNPSSEETILDPACGSGGFLFHGLDFVQSKESFSGEDLKQYCSTKLWGFDIDPRATKVAKALMILAGDGVSNIVRLNSLIRTEMYSSLFPESDNNSLTVEDIVRARCRNHKGFDLILTNPPFAGEVLEQQILDNYDASRGKSRIERDVLFIERCVDLLRPGGRMAIVLPHNKFSASEFSENREWLIKKCRILGVVGLGRNTFLPHTHQKTSILFVQKRTNGAPESLDENIFFAVSDRDGKDKKGKIVFKKDFSKLTDSWQWVDHDLDEILSSFEKFCKEEGLEFGGDKWRA
jgi:type I restriction enzyme M protein